MRIRPVSPLALFLLLAATVAGAQEFRIEETAPGVAALKPATIAFTDHRNDELTDPKSGLIRFSDWAKAKPLQRQLLSPYPGYEEPTLNITVNGVTKSYKKKLHMYVAEARFELARAPGAIDLKRFATLSVLERIDPAIKHRVIGSDEAIPNKSEKALNRHPDRRWCEGDVTCIQSHYRFEGKLPTGILLVNKLREGQKQIADFIEFQSEIRILPSAELDQATFAQLTGIDAPVASAVEQTIFHVNQVMYFGKFLAVFQPSPADPKKTVATTFMALAVETDLFEKKKEFENVPVLRNMVPAQVLSGNSSFNTGSSISAGLPKYARNRIKAIATMLERE